MEESLEVESAWGFAGVGWIKNREIATAKTNNRPAGRRLSFAIDGLPRFLSSTSQGVGERCDSGVLIDLFNDILQQLLQSASPQAAAVDGR